MNHATNPANHAAPSQTGMVKVLAKARAVVANSTAAEATTFDVESWLDEWIERPQPSLGGHRPIEFLDTPARTDIICRLLGAMESGSYL
jgi:uncharacterized protein (DUF2384 family)